MLHLPLLVKIMFSYKCVFLGILSSVIKVDSSQAKSVLISKEVYAEICGTDREIMKQEDYFRVDFDHF